MNEYIVLTTITVLSSLLIQFLAMTVTGIAKTVDVRMRDSWRKPFIYRIIRYCLFFWLIHLLLKKLNFSFYLSEYSLFENLERKWSWQPFTYYAPLLILLLSICYFLNNTRIRKNLSQWSYKKVPFKRGYWQFISSSIFINIGCLLIFSLTFMFSSTIENWFANRNMTILDWLIFTSNEKEDFTKGFYFSFLLSAFLTVIYLNSVIKYSTENLINVKSTKFYLLSIVLFFTLLTGIYSITNFLYNMQTRGFLSIYKEDQQLGVFALRLASLILLYHTFAFLSKNVMKSGLFEILYGGVSPYYKSSVKSSALSDRVHSTTFIAQIGFYIMNIAIAEFSLLLQEKNMFRNIVSFGLAFIVDDYIIIHNYSTKFKKVMYWHSRRIDIFNLILLISGFSILVSSGYYFFAGGYVILSFILGKFYYKNQDMSIEV